MISTFAFAKFAKFQLKSQNLFLSDDVNKNIMILKIIIIKNDVGGGARWKRSGGLHFPSPLNLAEYLPSQSEHP